MSSITTLFGDKFYRDPREAFDKALVHTNSIFCRDTAGTLQSPAAGTAFWTPYGTTASVAANDTYVTVCDITGKGFLNSVIGPHHETNTGITTTIRLTVNGQVYTFTGLSDVAGQRLVLQAYFPYKAITGTYQSEHIGFGTDSNMAPANVNDNTYRFSFTKFMHVIAYWAGKLSKMPLVRFDTSLKVEIKVSTVDSSNANYLRCGCAYKLDI